MDQNSLKYVIALQMVEHVGAVLAKNLIAYTGSAEAVFREKKDHLLNIPGVGPKIAAAVKGFSVFDRAEEEIRFIEKHGIKPLFYLNEDYPRRMKDLMDAPVLIYYKGNTDINSARVIGVVGTRNATDYGRSVTEAFVEGLAPYNVIIVSGLAYGIDAAAHKAALKHNIPTIGVMANGMDRIYPSTHRQMAEKMTGCGGLMTEYISGIRPDRERFPARNRIVAGLTDGLLIVETAGRGGALITAEISHSYQRELFAIPGRSTDEYSAGCNRLIKTNKAYMVETAEEMVQHLGWELAGATKKPARDKYKDITPSEKLLVNLLKPHDRLDVDTLAFQSAMQSSELSMLLLEMEFKGLVQALPGRFYRLV